MKITYIIRNGEIIRRFNYLLEIQEAISIVRTQNIKGRFQIHHVWYEEGRRVNKLTFVGNNDKVIGILFPFKTSDDDF